MNYELAKELKDAGFPQGRDHDTDSPMCWCNPRKVVHPDGGGMAILHSKKEWKGSYVFPIGVMIATEKMYEVGAYKPTLEELIEACGSQLIQIRQYAPHDWSAMAGSWLDGDPVHFCHVDATTPTEAVARLWLALHAR